MKGPLETVTWPAKLQARVVTPGTAPRVHGYDVEVDLAHNYRFHEVALLAVTGELADDERAAAADVAMQFAGPLSAGHGAVHASILARISGGTTTGIVGTAAIAVAEHVRTTMDAHAGLVEWLAASGTDDIGRAPATEWTNAADAPSVARLRDTLMARSVDVSRIAHGHLGALSRDAALIATLHFAGLASRETIEAVLVSARLPFVIAEAFAAKRNGYRDYPLDLPPFEYSEPS